MSTLHVITIIAEEALAPALERTVLALGAHGYTTAQVTGKGLLQLRDNPWDGENVRIESIVSEEVCQTIIQHLREHYLEQYALIAFHHPVSVIRPHHFT